MWVYLYGVFVCNIYILKSFLTWNVNCNILCARLVGWKMKLSCQHLACMCGLVVVILYNYVWILTVTALSSCMLLGLHLLFGRSSFPSLVWSCIQATTRATATKLSTNTQHVLVWTLLWLLSMYSGCDTDSQPHLDCWVCVCYRLWWVH